MSDSKNNPKIPAWRQKAACRGVDPDIFYPVTDEEAEDAKAICRMCHVQEACLEWALSTREKEGVWGGATSASGGGSSAAGAALRNPVVPP